MLARATTCVLPPKACPRLILEGVRNACSLVRWLRNGGWATEVIYALSDQHGILVTATRGQFVMVARWLGPALDQMSLVDIKVTTLFTGTMTHTYTEALALANSRPGEERIRIHKSKEAK